MAKSKKSRPKTIKKNSVKPKNHLWNIVTVMAVVISFGLIANLTFLKPTDSKRKTVGTSSVSSPGTGYGSKIQLVASKFRCACGGCGELPLDECTCDMPRGAREEKDFIQRELGKGLTIDQVVNAVDDKYGHRKT